MRRLGVVLGILALGACAYAFFSDSATLPMPGASYQERYAFWRVEFEKSDRAYVELIDSGRDLSYDDSHEVAHMAGELLYETIGLPGTALCTADFQYGCYHGFAGRALSDVGLVSVSDIRAACDSSPEPLGCIHGIGHGVLAFLGNEKLLEALRACASLKQESPVGGCFGGVFMEYNFNTMQSVAGISVRSFSENGANEPCEGLPNEFKIPCYFDQPAWWHAAATDTTADESDRFRSIGIRCAAIPPPYRNVCYQGIGNVIGPTSGYETTTMRAWCELLPLEGRESCQLFAEGHLRTRDL